MAGRRRLNKIADPFWRDLGNWPTISVPDKHEMEFERRMQLIRDYFESELTVKALCDRHDFSVPELYRFLDRILASDDSGGLIGWRALVPSRRMKAYIRQSESLSGYAGRFRKFLEDHSTIASKIADLHLNSRSADRLPGGRVPETVKLNEFHEMCVDAGLQMHDYPLCLKTGGREGLRSYLRFLDLKHPVRSAEERFGEEAVRNMAATKSKIYSRHPVLPYSDVECDAHRMDLLMVVYIADALGEVEPYIIERVWLYIVIDRCSRCVLGYQISLNPEPCLEDLLNCIANALVPWRPRQLSIEGLEYLPGSGIPSGCIKGLSWQLFDRIRLDNAKAHLSPWAQRKILDTVGATVTVGKVGEPVARAIVERFFGVLEEFGWHRLGATTGSSPKDHRRKDPGTYAKKYKITLDEIEQLLDVIITGFNAKFHAGPPLYGKRTPLGYLEAFVGTERFLPRTLRPDYRDCPPFLIRPVVGTVRGNSKERRRPYIRYENAIYKNHLLDDAWHLIGKKVRLDFNVEAAHKSPAHVIDGGADLGVLVAQPPWSCPHTFRVRKAIMALHNRGKLELGPDAMRSYERFKVKQMKNSTRAASAVAQIARNDPSRTGRGTQSEPIVSCSVPDAVEFTPRRERWISAGSAQARSNAPSRRKQD